MEHPINQQSSEIRECSRFRWGTWFGNIPAQIQSIGQSLHNGAARRTTNSIVVIANRLNRSAPLNWVGEVQRFSHNDSLNTWISSFLRGWPCLKRSLPLLRFFPFRHSEQQSCLTNERGHLRVIIVSLRLGLFIYHSIEYSLRREQWISYWLQSFEFIRTSINTQPKHCDQTKVFMT